METLKERIYCYKQRWKRKIQFYLTICGQTRTRKLAS